MTIFSYLSDNNTAEICNWNNHKHN